jgi:chromosome partitioning protein
MSRVIAISQHKGGVGKTITCASLGACLSEMSKSVLLVDLDPQASLTQSLGINPASLSISVYEALADHKPMNDIIVDTTLPGLTLAPSHINLAVADLEFGGRVGRERMLKKALAPIKDNYDFILIDCGPNLGLLTINALAAADSTIIPIQCELLSLYGMQHLLDTIKLVQEEINETLKIEGVLLTMFDSRARLSQDVVDNVRQTFGDKVFETIIRRRIKLAEAPATGTPITVYAAQSEAANDYRSLAVELLQRG